MPTLIQAANDFLSHKKIAVTGVSRKGDTAANAIYRKLKNCGYEVFPINPFAIDIVCWVERIPITAFTFIIFFDFAFKISFNDVR